jgi:hypothetical protein
MVNKSEDCSQVTVIFTGIIRLDKSSPMVCRIPMHRDDARMMTNVQMHITKKSKIIFSSIQIFDTHLQKTIPFRYCPHRLDCTTQLQAGVRVLALLWVPGYANNLFD